MIRRAGRDDIPRLKQIRAGVRENQLSDPSRVTDADILWFSDNPGIFVWDTAGEIAGFSAADPRDGSIWALFMDAGFERRGIAQALFAAACAVLTQAGWARQWLTTRQGTRAEAFYRRAGWVVTGTREGQLVFERNIDL